MKRLRYVLSRTLTPDHLRLARLRLFYWRVLRRYETELCQRCGGRVQVVWTAPDALWRSVMGTPGGIVCVPCFDARYWRLPRHPEETFLRWVPVDASMYPDVHAHLGPDA